MLCYNINIKILKELNMKFYESPAYIGLAKSQPTDNRMDIWEEQFKERGFDDSCTWSLDYTIVEFILPRLKVFLEFSKKSTNDDEFHKDIEEIIKGFEVFMSEDYHVLDEDKNKLIQKSFDLLAENARGLWW
jgi:hypothetical protein